MARQRKTSIEFESEKKSWAESYTSLLLGIIVVVVVGFIIFSFIRGEQQTQDISSVGDEEMTEEEEKEEATEAPKTYTVAVGDNLWSIAEKHYKSGYNWVDIAKENKLANANFLQVGNKLAIPDVEPKKITIVEESTKAPDAKAIKGDQYTVVSGDYLWDIAVRAYSDGYKWVEIAKANKLENPDLIFSGNKLKIPR